MKTVLLYAIFSSLDFSRTESSNSTDVMEVCVLVGAESETSVILTLFLSRMYSHVSGGYEITGRTGAGESGVKFRGCDGVEGGSRCQ